MKLSQFKEHPKNSYYFDDINKNEDNWQDFLEDIKIRGIQNKIIVHDNEDGTYTIISGHQRVKALKELVLNSNYKVDLSKITEIKSGMTQREILDDLINDNIQSRAGILGNSVLKQTRLVKYVSEMKGLSKGDVNTQKSGSDMSEPLKKKSRSELAEELGLSVAKLDELKKLDKLTPEIKQLMESGISPSNLRLVFSKLTKEEQKKFIEVVGVDYVAKTRKELETQVKHVIQEENSEYIAELKNSIEVLNKRAQKIALDADKTLADKEVEIDRIKEQHMKESATLLKKYEALKRKEDDIVAREGLLKMRESMSVEAGVGTELSRIPDIIRAIEKDLMKIDEVDASSRKRIARKINSVIEDFQSLKRIIEQSEDGVIEYVG